eukprot:5530067-Alexandrium_andersonii.AAC.1
MLAVQDPRPVQVCTRAVCASTGGSCLHTEVIGWGSQVVRAMARGWHAAGTKHVCASYPPKIPDGDGEVHEL